MSYILNISDVTMPIRSVMTVPTSEYHRYEMAKMPFNPETSIANYNTSSDIRQYIQHVGWNSSEVQCVATFSPAPRSTT